MRTWTGLAAGAVALLFATGIAPAAVDPTLVERSSETHGATTVTWDAAFEDLGYALGEPLTITVRWTVGAGAARASDLVLRGYTPRGPDPAAGTGVQVISRDDASVRATLRFTDLHVDRERGVSIGNAHLALVLRVDADGDGSVDTPVALGVNVHVEDPSGAPGPTAPREACAEPPATPGSGPPGRSRTPAPAVPL